MANKNSNKFDGGLDWGTATMCGVPYMRLADIYLMYAEACAAVSGASGHSSNYSLTAEDAVNTLRDRVGAEHVNAKFLGDKKKFMDEVRRERACELAFEGFRFNDLQRWLLLTDERYTVKTSQEFERVNDQSWYEENDPRDAEVRGWSEKEVVTRPFTERNYWFPFFKKDVSIYDGFDQNPGW